MEGTKTTSTATTVKPKKPKRLHMNMSYKHITHFTGPFSSFSLTGFFSSTFFSDLIEIKRKRKEKRIRVGKREKERH